MTDHTKKPTNTSLPTQPSTTSTIGMESSASSAPQPPTPIEESEESSESEIVEDMEELDDSFDTNRPASSIRMSQSSRRGSGMSMSSRRGGLQRTASNLSILTMKLNDVHVPKNLQKWPRCHACCCGIFLPLNIIVTVSLVVGLLLGKLEMQEEINGNNAVMRAEWAERSFASDLDTVFVDQLPQLCWGLYHAPQGEGSAVPSTEDDLNDVFEAIMTNRSLLGPYLAVADSEDLKVTNQTSLVEMGQFLAQCGRAGGTFRDDWLGLFQDSEEGGGSLSFNFIRCVNRSSPLAFNMILFPSDDDMHDALHSSQADQYAESWKQSQQELEQEYSTDGELTELEVLTQSYADASGDDKCAVNMPAAAWFFFTVMSTVGYGNQFPKTVWGRLVTCTLGFVSILMFGGMLGTAGGITNHIVWDSVRRWNKNVSKGTMVMVWGCCWLVWMLLISHQAMSYQERRVQQEFEMNDAYWFAFISTTTIGFGDYYLDPEGLFISDLVGLWGNFLIGFVLLSAFLTELSQLLGNSLPDLVGDLQQNLKYADKQGGGKGGGDLNLSEQERSERRKQMAQAGELETSDTNQFSHPILRRGRRPDRETIIEKPSNGGPTRKTTIKKVTRPTIITVGKPTIIHKDKDQEGDNSNNNNPSVTQETQQESQHSLLPKADDTKKEQAPPEESKEDPAQQQPTSSSAAPPAAVPPQQQTAPGLQRSNTTESGAPKRTRFNAPFQRSSTTGSAPPRRAGRRPQPPKQQSEQESPPPLQQPKETPGAPPAAIPPQQPAPRLQRSNSTDSATPKRTRFAAPFQRSSTTGNAGAAPSSAAKKWPTVSTDKPKAPSTSTAVPPAAPQAASSAPPAATPPATPGLQRSNTTDPKAALAQKKRTAPFGRSSTTGNAGNNQKTPRNVNFANTGADPAMAQAELYYERTRWGPLGHGSAPISVSTYPGDKWYIVANGVYAKLFTVGQEEQQKFTI